MGSVGRLRCRYPEPAAESLRHAPLGRGARRRRARAGVLLLLEAHQGSAAYQAIARAAAARSVGWSVEPLGGPDALLDRHVPDSAVIGIGPGLHPGEPIQTARHLRRAGVRAPLIFFADSQSSFDATRAELLRDPFAVDRYELVRADDPRLLSEGLARVARLLRRAPQSEPQQSAPRAMARANPSANPAAGSDANATGKRNAAVDVWADPDASAEAKATATVTVSANAEAARQAQTEANAIGKQNASARANRNTDAEREAEADAERGGVAEGSASGKATTRPNANRDRGDGDGDLEPEGEREAPAEGSASGRANSRPNANRDRDREADGDVEAEAGREAAARGSASGRAHANARASASSEADFEAGRDTEAEAKAEREGNAGGAGNAGREGNADGEGNAGGEGNADGEGNATGVSDHFLTNILSQANDAIMSTDPRGVVLTWNVAAERLFGYRGDQAVGQPIALLDDPQAPPRTAEAEAGMRAMAQRVLDTGTPEQAEASCRRADGGRVTVDVSIAPVRSPDGQLLGLSVIARDNSDRRRAAEALREANRQKDEFLAIMSHELRTPLTSILGYTDMLLRGLSGPLGGKTARYVGNVRTAGDRLLELVNGLLDFTRLEAGREQIEARSISLHEVARTAVERAELNARAKGIRLELRLDPGADRVLADPEKLQHVLASYLANAIKFTPADGSVCVDVAPDPDEANEVRVRVSDSGIGLRNDQLARVWERFYQGDASLTRPYGGMGLGLSIARHLVQLHGGRVGVDSAGPGHGSTFWLSLPRPAG